MRPDGEWLTQLNAEAEASHWQSVSATASRFGRGVTASECRVPGLPRPVTQ